MKNKKRNGILLLLGLALLPLLSVVFYFKLPALGWLWWQMQVNADSWRQESLWLPDYQASIEAQPIVGIASNASGLTFNEASGTLFAVINKPAEIIELNTAGQLLRRITVAEDIDLEGIAYMRDGLFIISDERKHQLYQVHITPETRALSLAGSPRLGIGIDLNGNLGFEGLSWDELRHRLYVVKEKSPLRVLSIDGLDTLFAGKGSDLQIAEWKTPAASGRFLRDLSSLSIHEASGNLMLLSDESALIVEFSAAGEPRSMLPLWRGLHGLSRSVPQAEGMTIGPDGSIYLISEPNLFYRFEPPTKAERRS